MFPPPEHDNIGFHIVNPGSAKPFSAVAVKMTPDLVAWISNAGQFFPWWTWKCVEVADGVLDLNLGRTVSTGQKGQDGETRSRYRHVDNVADEILSKYRAALGDVTKDDIFHFVYGQLHDTAYRAKYAADLKKMLPHIETPISREWFDMVVAAGSELTALHVEYEDVEAYPLDVQIKQGCSEDDREMWHLTKVKWAKCKGPETGKSVNDVTKTFYNTKLTITGFPEDSEDYLLGSGSVPAWIIDLYQVKKDKASGIVRDPNDWGQTRCIIPVTLWM
ncbi:hypothetical protein GCM10007338_18940 [Corynebacterium pelargi]|uniref:Uncharacterized protein n=1 Tax=Corynebacterium pelargi TaxID=1471400 RepID=A0A410W6N6_9CORY|nr:hypothetical protein CPELA_02005 [Corynebacterium pelargi]GGG80596.1 hypothetical protein GCM10007338_18940 [Corynebacterium pelargi]